MNPLMPMNEMILASSLNLFTKVSIIVTSLVGLILIMRFSFLVIRVAHGSEYLDVITDAVKYLGVTSLFPYLVRLTMEVSGSLARKVSYINESQR